MTVKVEFDPLHALDALALLHLELWRTDEPTGHRRFYEIHRDADGVNVALFDPHENRDPELGYGDTLLDAVCSTSIGAEDRDRKVDRWLRPEYVVHYDGAIAGRGTVAPFESREAAQACADRLVRSRHPGNPRVATRWVSRWDDDTDD